MYSPLWKIPHQKPSVLCTPPFEKSLFLVGAYFGKYSRYFSLRHTILQLYWNVRKEKWNFFVHLVCLKLKKKNGIGSFEKKTDGSLSMSRNTTNPNPKLSFRLSQISPLCIVIYMNVRYCVHTRVCIVSYYASNLHDDLHFLSCFFSSLLHRR